MKFGLFQDYALEQGFDAIATGHYVRKVINPDGTQDLLEGIDKNKDQSYFLALLSQKQLQKAEFPIGHLKKSDVRTIAQNNKLPNSEKKRQPRDLLPWKYEYQPISRTLHRDSPGPIINHEDKILGEHKGLHRFTVGQRRGIGVPSNTDNEAYVVTRLDFQNNALYVAFDKEDSPYLYALESEIDAISYINKPIETTTQLLAKPRYRDPLKQSLSHQKATPMLMYNSQPSKEH